MMHEAYVVGMEEMAKKNFSHFCFGFVAIGWSEKRALGEVM